MTFLRVCGCVLAFQGLFLSKWRHNGRVHAHSQMEPVCLALAGVQRWPAMPRAPRAGVIAAAALKCMGGSMQGRLYPRNDDERAKAEEQGYDVTRVLYADDLCAGEQVRRTARRPARSAARHAASASGVTAPGWIRVRVAAQVFFAATGVSDGDLLKGVRYYSGGASTNSIVMRSSSGTVRFIETQHRWRGPPAPLSDCLHACWRLLGWRLPEAPCLAVCVVGHGCVLQ